MYDNFYDEITGNSMKMWVGCMDDFRSAIYKKVNNPPCEIEKFANTGEINAGIGLHLVDIPFDEFFISFLYFLETYCVTEE